jgi:hypothetical protein
VNSQDIERTVPESEARLIDLVKSDYDATLRALNGFVTAATAIRGVGVAMWGVIAGLAINAESAPLAVLAFGATLIFAFIDAYHSTLYRHAMSRAVAVESLLNDYAETLGIYADDPEAIDKLRTRLELHAFGVNRTLRRFRLNDMFDARPWPVFMVLYPTLLLSAVVVFFVYAR